MINFAIDLVGNMYKKTIIIEMKKFIIASLIGFVAIGMLSSCNKSKTYAQRLSDEKKVIERFVESNNLKILKEYPQDSVFKSNEFYFDTSSGVYYNVIDAGSSRRIKTGEELYIRFKGLTYISEEDTTTYSNINSLQPEVLVYGNSSTYSSTGWVAPLKNVGDRAKVKMIVPFNAGLASDNTSYRTAYYEEIDYRFEN